MLFNSLEFLLFLPIVFLLYWFVFNKNIKAQNFFIVAVSYLFYGWWDWTFLLLIAFTTLCSYFSGLLVEKYKDQSEISKWICIGNVLLNLGVLGIYKYYDFFIESFASAFDSFGIHLSIQSLGLVLPVGISFYTFQALSYTIDVYKKKIESTHDVVSFFAYVSFFPQLVAGPIERATNLLPQFTKRRVFNYEEAVDGCRQILWGFFKKMVVADNCATAANLIFDTYQDQTGSTLFLGAMFFTFQIYGDFSGYSDIAIGVAKLFGITLMRNFHYPYFSRDIAEFWRRWHISLTTWFRDYIYIPLGGSRVSKIKVIRNTFIIFLVSGFWHGANWTFVVWGAYHALLFMPLLILGKNRKNTDVVAFKSTLPSFREILQMSITFFFVVIGWIVFRAENIYMAYDYIRKVFHKSFFTMPTLHNKTAIAAIFILVLVEWIRRENEFALRILPSNIYMRYIIYIFFLVLILTYAGDQTSFIYFQF